MNTRGGEQGAHLCEGREACMGDVPKRVMPTGHAYRRVGKSAHMWGGEQRRSCLQALCFTWNRNRRVKVVKHFWKGTGA